MTVASVEHYGAGQRIPNAKPNSFKKIVASASNFSFISLEGFVGG